jgi:VCBS repeat-containing protein
LSDGFDYTASDGALTADSTLTISVFGTNDAPVAVDSNAVVNEAALDTHLLPDGFDLAVGTVNGSNPNSSAETVKGQLAATDPNGDALTYTAGTFSGTYGLIHIYDDGSYTYTLTKPYHTTPDANDGITTIDNAETFHYTVTDTHGSSSQGHITIDIVDDVPVFTHIDSGIMANEAGLLTGTHDINFGADGESAINLTAMTSLSGLNYSSAIHNADGSTTITAGTGTDASGNPITDGFFALTVNPDGTYDFNLIEARPTTDHTVVFPEIQGGAGVPFLTIGTGADAITFTGIGGDTIKPTSAGFGVNDGNLNYGDEWSISFSGNAIDSVTYDIKQQGSKPLTMHWTTDAGDSGDESYSANGTFTIDPTHDFHTIYFSVEEGSNAKVDSFSYSQNLLPESQNLQFGVSAIDGDGDISAPHTLNIELLGGDHIVGGAGDDILTGTLGDDLMTGGAGADIFKTGIGNDHITDYSITQGDKVDITAVLNTVDPTDTSHLGFNTDVNGHAVLDIYDSGTDHSAAHLVGSVTFDNITTATDLNSLLGQVDIDHTT